MYRKLSPLLITAAAVLTSGCTPASANVKPDGLVSSYKAYLSGAKNSPIMTEFQGSQNVDPSLKNNAGAFGAATEALFQATKANGFQQVSKSVTAIAQNLDNGDREANAAVVLTFTWQKDNLKAVGANDTSETYMNKVAVLGTDTGKGDLRKVSELLVGNPENFTDSSQGNAHNKIAPHGWAYAWDAMMGRDSTGKVPSGQMLSLSEVAPLFICPTMEEQDPYGKVFRDAKANALQLAAGNVLAMRTVLHNGPQAGIA